MGQSFLLFTSKQERKMLPENFLKRMETLLGEEYPNYLESIEEPRHHALRINTLRGSVAGIRTLFPELVNPVLWEETGMYYGAELPMGKHPLHEAGAYYIQEPSAMAPGHYLEAKPGERVLDLCAAPGGKTTQIAAAMKGMGLLISNEIHPARAKILSENVERMGIRNCLVTNETPAKLAKNFPEFFHRIMVDAPCSGEGMFRKNETATENWSEENVALCAARQKEILSCAQEMLLPGGRLVYSTCTFAPEENEQVIEWFLKEYPEFEEEDVQLCEGMVKGYGNHQGAIRLFPHKLSGEGHFVCVLRKRGKIPEEIGIKSMKSLSEKEIADYRAWEKKSLAVKMEGTFLRFGDELYVAPKDCPELKGLKVLRPGLHLATLKKGRIEPAHALSHALTKEELLPETGCFFEMDDLRVKAYLHGETFPVEGEGGFRLVFVENYGLGWGKNAGGTLKNHYPKGLRTQF